MLNYLGKERVSSGLESSFSLDCPPDAVDGSDATAWFLGSANAFNNSASAHPVAKDAKCCVMTSKSEHKAQHTLRLLSGLEHHILLLGPDESATTFPFIKLPAIQQVFLFSSLLQVALFICSTTVKGCGENGKRNIAIYQIYERIAYQLTW